MTKTITALAALLALWTLSTAAWALDPETATLVTDFTLEVPSTFTIDEDEVAFVGSGECEDMVRNSSTIRAAFTTAFDPTTTDGETLFEEADIFFVDRDSTARIDCATGDLCTRVDEEDVTFSADTISVELDFETLTGITTEEECTGFDREYFIRVVVNESATSTTLEGADAKIVIDTVRPTAPAGVVASATENTITVDAEPVEDDDVSAYFVFWSSTGFEAGADPDELELERSALGESPSGSVTADLNPTGTIFVAVAARDESGNFSELSSPTEISVVETDDFWEAYKAEGGAEAGGCATADGSASAWPLLLLIGLFGLGRSRRRTRSLLVASGAALVLLTPMTAAAESPTHGAFGLKLGGYYPAIDDEFGGSGPFSDIFGEKNLVMGEVEVTGWLYQGIGKAGIGGSWGFSKVKGTALAADTTESDVVADTTSFGVMPFRTFGVYRFDWLAQHTVIPLSASVEAGLDFYRWRIANGAGDTASFDGAPGSGWKRGYHLGAELQFLLDFLDDSTAAAFDFNWGINNSYFFVEYLMTKVNSFGNEGFDLSDNIVMLGLNFEF